MIQGLLNSGGKSAAMQRATQINNYVNSANKQVNPQQSMANSLDAIYPPGANNVQSFEKVLSSTSAANFGSLLLNPKSLNVNGNIYDNDDINTDGITNATLRRAIQEVNDASRKYSPEKSQSTNKTQLIGMINKVAQRHGVDEKLVQAVIKQESGFNPKAT